MRVWAKGLEKRAKKKKATKERARGRDGRFGGGKMERLSYETQRQLPRSPPLQFLLLTGRRDDDLTLFPLFG